MTPAGARPPFRLRVGAMLVAPRAALAAIDARGGGVRDAFLLVLLGVLCFRLQEVARAVLGLAHLDPGAVLAQVARPIANELNEAILVVIPAAVGVTVLAGRGRRDPPADLELGAACYVPFFAVRAVHRAVEALAGPLPAAGSVAALAAAGAAAAAALAVAAGVARGRPPPPAAGPPPPRPDPPPPPARARIAALIVAAVLAAGLTGNGAWVVRHADAVRPMRRGQAAPAFALPRIDGGGSLSLADLHGRVVLLDFWATWCQPCIGMMPMLHDLQRELGPRGLTLVGINSDGDATPRAEVEAFVRAHPAPYPIVLDEDGRVGSRYKVTGLPHLVLLGREGRVEKVFWGYSTRAELQPAILRALGP